MAPENRGDDDPFEHLTLNEDFVREASVREETAAARIARLQRIDQEHRRLADQRELDRQAAARSLTPKRRPSGRGWIAVVLVIVLVGVLYWSNTRDDGGGSTAPGVASLTGADATTDTIAIAGGAPPPGEPSATPLGTPAPLTATDDSYVFMQTQTDSSAPVAYSPCRPIHFVVNDTRLPTGDRETMAQIFDQAVARVSSATGLRFVYDGPSDEAPLADRTPYQPDRYPDRWAPVLVAWSDPGQTPALEGDTAGIGGSAALDLAERGAVYLTGTLVLDTDDLLAMLDGPDGEALVRSVILHELAHVVGLAHVDDETQLMDDEGHPGVTDFAAGDLTGLSRLGQGACFPQV